MALLYSFLCKQRRSLILAVRGKTESNMNKNILIEQGCLEKEAKADITMLTEVKT